MYTDVNQTFIITVVTVNCVIWHRNNCVTEIYWEADVCKFHICKSNSDEGNQIVIHRRCYQNVVNLDLHNELFCIGNVAFPKRINIFVFLCITNIVLDKAHMHLSLLNTYLKNI